MSPPSKWHVAREASWLVFGQIAAALAVFAGIRLMTEIVSPAVYGEVTLCVGLGLLAYNVCAYPYSQAALRYFPEVERQSRIPDMHAAIWADLLPATVVLALGLIATGTLQSLLHHGNSGTAFAAVAVIFVVDVIRIIQQSFYNAGRNQRAYAIWSAADAWVRPLAAVVAVLVLGPTSGAVLIGYAVGVTLLLPFLYTRFGPYRAAEKADTSVAELRRTLRRYAIPLIPLAFTTWFSTFSDRYFIRILLNSADVGVYAAVYGLASRPFNVCNGVLLTLFRPRYFEHLARGETGAAERLFRNWFIIATAILGFGVMGAYAAKDFVGWLALNERFRSGVSLLPPIALGHALMSLAQTMNVVSLGYKRPQLATAAELTGAVASVVAVPLIYCFGIAGAAWAVPIYYGLQLLAASGLATLAKRSPRL